MFFGNPYIERIQLNEDSVWFGGKQDRLNPSAKEKLPEIRRLIFEGRIREAEELCCFALSGTPEEQRHYECLGNLYIEFMGRETEYSDYERCLDISRAVADMSFTMNGIRYTREVITSYPKNVMAVHLTADKPGSLNFHAQLGRGFAPWENLPYEMLSIRRQNYNHYVDSIKALPGNIQIMEATSGGKGSISSATAIKVIPTGGTVENIGNTAIVRGADEALILLAADTTFREDDPADTVVKRLSSVAECSWEEILEEHIRDYQSLFNRVTLDIEGQEKIVRFFQFATQMRLVYGDNAIIGICFIVVCLFRDIIIRHRREFPTLFLFGPKGTGKTAFGELLQSVFVYNGDHPNLRTSTMPSLATVLSQAEDAIMHLDEYKNDIDVEKIELLKGLWDCQGRSKLDIETRKREQSKVLSGVIVSGQEKPTVDIALYSRQCVLPFHKDTHTTEEKENFRVLKDWEYEGTSYIVLELLQVRTQFEQSYKDCYEQAVKSICTSLTFCIDERILHNWSVVLASYMAVQQQIQFPFTYEEVFKTVLNGVEYQNEECLHSNELSIFWKTVDYLKHDNQIYGLCDYRIHEYTSLKVDIKMDGRRQTVTREYGNAKKILMIPTNSRMFALYALHLQKTREKVIPENTLKYYLENSPEYIGKVNSVRFASVENVKDWPRQFEAKCFQCQPRLSEKPVQAFCLDFEAVEAAYGISLYSDYMAFDLVHNS